MVRKKEAKTRKSSLIKGVSSKKQSIKQSSKTTSTSTSTPLLVGTITHYYSNIGVGVVEVKKEVKLGDALQIFGRGKTFAQKAKSMQMEHLPITMAKKGHIIGLKVNKPVKPNDLVFKFK